jgi:ribosomal protein L4
VAGTQNALVLYTPAQQDEVRYIRNLEQATALHVGYLNIRDLLSHEKLVLSLAALDHIKSHLG